MGHAGLGLAGGLASAGYTGNAAPFGSRTGHKSCCRNSSGASDHATAFPDRQLTLG